MWVSLRRWPCLGFAPGEAGPAGGEAEEKPCVAERPLGKGAVPQGNRSEERVAGQGWGFSRGALLVCSERGMQLSGGGRKMNIASGIA